MKKVHLALALALGAPCVLLAEGTPTFTMDTSAASSAVTEIKTKIVSFFTDDMMPAVLAILGVGLGLWLVLYCIKRFRKGAANAG